MWPSSSPIWWEWAENCWHETLPIMSNKFYIKLNGNRIVFFQFYLFNQFCLQPRYDQESSKLHVWEQNQTFNRKRTQVDSRFASLSNSSVSPVWIEGRERESLTLIFADKRWYRSKRSIYRRWETKWANSHLSSRKRMVIWRRCRSIWKPTMSPHWPRWNSCLPNWRPHRLARMVNTWPGVSRTCAPHSMNGWRILCTCLWIVRAWCPFPPLLVLFVFQSA